MGNWKNTEQHRNELTVTFRLLPLQIHSCILSGQPQLKAVNDQWSHDTGNTRDVQMVTWCAINRFIPKQKNKNLWDLELLNKRKIKFYEFFMVKRYEKFVKDKTEKILVLSHLYESNRYCFSIVSTKLVMILLHWRFLAKKTNNHKQESPKIPL